MYWREKTLLSLSNSWMRSIKDIYVSSNAKNRCGQVGSDQVRKPCPAATRSAYYGRDIALETAIARLQILLCLIYEARCLSHFREMSAVLRWSVGRLAEEESARHQIFVGVPLPLWIFLEKPKRRKSFARTLLHHLSNFLNSARTISL